MFDLSLMVVATDLVTQQKQVPQLLRIASWEGYPQPASLSLGLPLLGRGRETSDFKVDLEVCLVHL